MVGGGDLEILLNGIPDTGTASLGNLNKILAFR